MPSSASVCAESTWARITTRPWSLRATCTATAPEAVRTFRTYATARTYPVSTPKHPPTQPKHQVRELRGIRIADGVQTQVLRRQNGRRVMLEGVSVDPARTMLP